MFGRTKSHENISCPPLNCSRKYCSDNEQIFNVLEIPDGESEEEWMAFNIAELINQMQLLYDYVKPTCTCASMDCGARRFLKDGKQIPATKFFEHFLGQLNNFVRELPDGDATFPKNFQSMLQKPAQALARMYLHLFYFHYDKIAGYLEKSFQVFWLFAIKYDILKKDDIELCAQVCSILNLPKKVK